MGPPLRIIYDAQRLCKASSASIQAAAIKCLLIQQISYFFLPAAFAAITRWASSLPKAFIK
ncbi:MAG: hypothetical protein M1363_06030, partial [Gammaproteobacteria bacterium]|nr:hypothetical protein [Gammaproteobacteria bacterium]